MTAHRVQHAWLCWIALVTALLSSVSVAAASTVPFRATIGFTEQVAPSTDANCSLTGTISGGGEAAKLGSVQLNSTDCINPLSQTLFLFLSDTVVLTVDGGQIFAAYGGTLSSTNGVIQGKYFIFGGTGRFENASGVGTIAGFEAINPTTGVGMGQIQLKGTLSY